MTGCGGQAASSSGEADRVANNGPAGGAAAVSAGHGSTTPTGTPLYTRLITSSAVGGTGQALTAMLAGATYRSATGVWVGCEGTAATAVYRLSGDFAKLTGLLGLQPHTPADLQVRVSIVVDGGTRLSVVLTRNGQPQSISIPVADARILTVSALATVGQCAPAAAPYGAIGAASLT
ncbi:NPCBM/NEW2 domain-containing protein [Tsukamurella sp. NPDC003166]|uniref:NPCBM/NEW2 domain-containing protein n=1 Tax=Tsukamurella sp. NPDC003166 TaxID=3154444 RepID=UPI0033B23B1B